jgi:hypothetical protein
MQEAFQPPLAYQSPGFNLAWQRTIFGRGWDFRGIAFGCREGASFRVGLCNRRGHGRLPMRVIHDVCGRRGRSGMLEDSLRTVSFSSIFRIDRDQNIAAVHFIVIP